MVKKIPTICFILLFSGKAISQTYNENVKWSLGINYNGGSLRNTNDGKNKWINKYSAVLATDVSLSKVSYFDSGEFFLQPFVEVSLPVKNPYDSNLQFATYGGGVNLKKYISFNYEKSRFYLFAGGQINYIIWKIAYTNRNQEKQYRNTNIDYILNLGAGVVITDLVDILTTYSKGLGKVYFSNDLYSMNTFSSFSIGLKISFSKNRIFRTGY